MRKIHTDKFFYVCAMILATVIMAIVQNIIDISAAKADESEAAIDLAPERIQKDAEQGSTASADGTAQGNAADAIGFALVPENAVTATADGTLSDFLVPKEEGEMQGSIPEAEARSFRLDGQPTVLIYHTHTTEAYRQTESYTYKENGEYRTLEQDKNITAVGSALKAELESMGFRVFHDTTDHEPPKLSTSYERSLLTMQEYMDEYGIDIFIDVHRDAAGVENNTEDIVAVDGKRCARLMFVAGQGTNYAEKPDFDSNYALADALTRQLEQIQNGFTRSIRTKTGRYNQHLSNMSLLVEVGHNANTLEEALNAMPYLAESLYAVIKG